jgi:glucosamine 6-phosphate synthetase-like amidotransferase/phosphosugar isomerase protein
MCGIVTGIYTGKKCKAINNWIINQMEDQKDRGTEGFGAILIDANKNIKVKRSTEISKILIDLYMNQAPIILLHHRTPTSSDNKISQTHPILVSNKSLKFDYYIMHNGIVRNDDELKIEHNKQGFKYTTQETTKDYYNNKITKFNDSESVAIEMAKYIEGKIKEMNIEGSAALVALQVNKTTRKATNIYFGRHSNPLNLLREGTEILLSSEGPGKSIKENKLFRVSMKNFKITVKKLKFKKEEKTVKIERTCYAGYQSEYNPVTHELKENNYQSLNPLWIEDKEKPNSEIEQIIKEADKESKKAIDDFISTLRIYAEETEYELNPIEREEEIELNIDELQESLASTMKDILTLNMSKIRELKDYWTEKEKNEFCTGKSTSKKNPEKYERDQHENENEEQLTIDLALKEEIARA